jgi:hypothetical protein
VVLLLDSRCFDAVVSCRIQFFWTWLVSALLGCIFLQFACTWDLPSLCASPLVLSETCIAVVLLLSEPVWVPSMPLWVRSWSRCGSSYSGS